MADITKTAAEQAAELQKDNPITVQMNRGQYLNLRREVVAANFSELENLSATRREKRIVTLTSQWINDKVAQASDARDSRLKDKRLKLALKFAKESGLSIEQAHIKMFDMTVDGAAVTTSEVKEVVAAK